MYIMQQTFSKCLIASIFFNLRSLFHINIRIYIYFLLLRIMVTLYVMKTDIRARRRAKNCFLLHVATLIFRQVTAHWIWRDAHAHARTVRRVCAYQAHVITLLRNCDQLINVLCRCTCSRRSLVDDGHVVSLTDGSVAKPRSWSI